MSMWNNTELQECFCWDSEERTWCEDQQCHAFWRGATSEVFVGCSVIGLMILILLFWVVVSAVNCAMKEKNEGTTNKTVVKGYKILSTIVFVSLLFCCYLATETASGDGNSSLKSIADVVVLKLSDDTTRVSTMQASVTAIQQLPGNYISYDVLKKFNGIYSSVNSYSDEILSAKSHVLSDFPAFSILTVWSPALFCFISFILIICNVHKCCSYVNVWFLSLTMFFFCCIQFIVAAFSYTSSAICNDYEGVASTTVKIWSSTFGWTYGGQSGVNQLTDDIKTSFRDTLCTRDFEGWEEYFSNDGGCGDFASLFDMINYDSSLRNSMSDDRGDCYGSCSIAECATRCTPGSGSQVKASNIVNAYVTISSNTKKISDELIPLVTGDNFPQFLSMLQPPLCHEFEPAATIGNTKLCAIAALLLFMLIASIFIPIIFYKTPASEYRIITNVEEEDLECPNKPMMFAPSAPVLK